MLVIQDTGIVCLGVEIVFVDDLPVDSCLARFTGVSTCPTEVCGLVDEALG